MADDVLNWVLTKKYFLKINSNNYVVIVNYIKQRVGGKVKLYKTYIALQVKTLKP